MPLRALAFGPLPKSQVQASQRLSLPSPSGAPSLSGLGSSGQDQGYDAALTVGGPLQREPESFNPVFPDLFGTEQGGDVSSLPGAPTPDFTSSTARSLASPAVSQNPGAIDPGAFQNDVTRALKALQQGLRLGKSGKSLLDYWMASSSGIGGGGFPTSGAGLASEVGAGLAPPSDVFNPDALGGSAGAGASGGTSVAGGLGAASAGGAALSAILSILAQATNNPDLAMAAKAAGAATGGLSLAGTGANLAGLVSALGGVTAAGEAAGTAGAAAAGAGAGLGVGAGAAFAPIAAMMLASTISGLAGGEDPIGEGIGEAMSPLMGRWATFAPELAQTLGAESTGLQALHRALPYVQSQEDLGQLLDQFRSNQAQKIGGYGQGWDRFTIPNLPGAGGSSHEGGISADFGPQVNYLNDVIRKLQGFLPATPQAGQTPGADLWSTAATNLAREQARATGLDLNLKNYLTPEQWAETSALFPEPSPMPASTSGAWQQVMAPQSLDQVLRALMGGGNA